MPQLKSNERHLDYRKTWRARVLGLIATITLFSIAAATAHFATTALDEHGSSRIGASHRVIEPTAWKLNLSPQERLERSRLWYENVYILPPGVDRGGLLATLAAAVVCAIVAGMGIFFTICLTNSQHARWRRIVLPAWYAIALLASSIAFVYSFMETYTSSTLDVDAFFAAGPRIEPPGSWNEQPFGGEGTYSVESYSCQARPIFRFRGLTIPTDKCNGAMTSRWMTVPMFVLAFLLCLLTLIYPPWRVSSKHKVATQDDEMKMSPPDDCRASDETGKASSAGSKIDVRV